MRIKDVAHRLEANNRILVLFDELFRGTNVKDAYDGTVAVVSAFAKIRTSFFVISTHIVEAARELESKANIQFSYFDIKEEDGHPVYTYKLKEGVSDVRLGMYIINKEGVIDLINNINCT
jgi:Mismatch repair ATPase (MutS family)